MRTQHPSAPPRAAPKARARARAPQGWGFIRCYLRRFLEAVKLRFLDLNKFLLCAPLQLI
jgi:hypothetical protein